MYTRTPLSQCTALGLAMLSLAGAQYLPDSNSHIVREFESIYLDGGSTSLVSAVNPCSKYTDPTSGKAVSTTGRQSAAEWIRTAFHDFVTATIFQTGGVDASIGFETDRNENIGPAFVDSLTRFSFYFNQKVSMADMIALGVSTATSACGGPHVPFRAGRKDATQAGPTGVPKPEDSVQQILTDTANANFNQDDTIALTACGHTLGGVHEATFPQVVPQSAVSSTNTDGRQDFDTSVAIFDVNVVNEYLQGTGNKGGPLVTTSNETVRSDLRLYSSDNNATMKRLSQSQSYFQGQCQGVFQRMIETVPGGTRFTSFIDPSVANGNVKPYNLRLDMSWAGEMTLSGQIRYVQVSGAPAAPSTMNVGLTDRTGKATTTTATASSSGGDTGSGLWGPTRSFQFSLKFPSTVGVSGISAYGQTFSLQDSMFAVKGLSSVTPTPPTFSLDSAAMGATATYKANVTVAYLPASGSAAPATLSAVFAIPVPQTGTVSPKIDTSTTATLNKIGNIGAYTIYSAVTSKSMTAKQAYGSSVDVSVPGSSTPGLMFFKAFTPPLVYFSRPTSRVARGLEADLEQ